MPAACVHCAIVPASMEEHLYPMHVLSFVNTSEKKEINLLYFIIFYYKIILDLFLF